MSIYQCLFCHGTFRGYSERRYCSHACANRGTEAGKRINQRLVEFGKRRKPVIVTCLYCQNPFQILACYLPRKFCSKRCHALYRRGKPSPQRKSINASFGIGGYRPDLRTYFRSRWEANYARYLKASGHNFIYEPEQFIIRLPDGRAAAYRPDFLVNDTYYVEIKGWMRRGKSEQAIIETAQQQLPKPLFLLRGDQYRMLERKFAAKVKHWEYKGAPPPQQKAPICPSCGVSIISPYGVAHRQFCSRKCSAISHRKPQVEKPCPICGTILRLSPWQMARKTCSRNCAATWKHLTRQGIPWSAKRIQSHRIQIYH